MEQYLIDTNIISKYFSEQFSLNALNFISTVIDATPKISIISKIESLSWINDDKTKENIIQLFVDDAIVIELNDDVAKIAVQIRRMRKIKTPDAIIAATAISNNLTLISCDKDFQNIKNLKIVNPIDL